MTVSHRLMELQAEIKANPTSFAPVSDTGAFSLPTEDVSSITSIRIEAQNVNLNPLIPLIFERVIKQYGRRIVFTNRLSRSIASVTARFIKVFTCIWSCYRAHERGQRGTHGSLYKRCFKSVKGKLKGKQSAQRSG